MYVQVIPIYFDSDAGASEFFALHREEVDLVTRGLHVVMQRSLGARPPDDVFGAIDSNRFPGLLEDDIPCLWVECGEAHFKARMPPDRQGVARYVRCLSRVMRKAQSFQDGQEHFFRLCPEAAPGSPNDPRHARSTILSLHGFNTRADWQRDIQPACNEAEVNHVPWTYGFVGVRKLLSPPDRNGKVEWFVEKYEHFVRTLPKGSPLPSVIAHSYGSYIVAEAMKKYPLIKFDRIILCGSIVRRDFDWDAVRKRGQFDRLLNDFGGKDIWARVAEWVISDAGSSGYRGFCRTAGGAVQQRHNQFWGHSSYFRLLNFRQRWLPFLVRAVDPPELALYRVGKLNLKFATVASVLVLGAVAAACFFLR
jgi:pimeloyl-ACP methyl ester carboxylesterase